MEVRAIEEYHDRVPARSTAWYEVLFNGTHDAIFILDCEGGLVEVNSSASRISGYDLSELLQIDFTSLFIEPDRNTYLKFFSRVLNGETIVAELPIRRKDGRIIDGELSNKRLILDDIKYVMVVVRDITRLRKAKEALRKLTFHTEKVREDERSRIALDLHDDLGQKLTALKMDIAWLKPRIQTDEVKIISKTDEMLYLIDDTIKTVQRICSELRPGILYDLGLPAAIEWFLGNFSKNTGIETVANIVPEEMEIEERLAVILYRIIQEAMTNVARHSQADMVSVSLIKTNERIKLTVRDNGVGISEEVINSPGSFGLFGMRERAKVCGGEVTIKGLKGRGTSVLASFNIDTVKDEFI
jgi:PAS domain S-box-containing protein